MSKDHPGCSGKLSFLKVVSVHGYTRISQIRGDPDRSSHLAHYSHSLGFTANTRLFATDAERNLGVNMDMSRSSTTAKTVENLNEEGKYTIIITQCLVQNIYDPIGMIMA